MSDLFDVDGANLDPGFENLKLARFPLEQQLRAMLQEVWVRYEPYADPDFRQGFARDVDGRFWEMYLGSTLLEAGRALLPVIERQREGGQPDLCVLEDNRRIWIEAITPNEGAQGPDRIWSRVGIGNLSRQVRPITYVHNPLAQVSLPTNWGVWDREFVTTQHGDEWKANDILAQAPAAEAAS